MTSSVTGAERVHGPGGDLQRGPHNGVASESGAVLSSGALASTGADGPAAPAVVLTGLLLLLLGGVLVRAARAH